MKTILTTQLLICMMLLCFTGKAQLVTISGKVTNSKSGEALENVSVFDQSSNIGTITNKNGFFKLALTKGPLEIKISDDGFKDYSRYIVLKNDTTLVVKLESEIQNKNRTKKQSSLQSDSKDLKKISGNNINKKYK